MKNRFKKSKGIPQAIFLIFAFLFIPAIVKWFNIVKPDTAETYSSYDYAITSYDVDMELWQDNSLTIEETITVSHNEYMHGIVRAIPKLQTVTFEYNGEEKSMNYLVDVDLKSSSVECETYEESGVYYFRFGDENQYVIGNKTYNFVYDVKLGDDRLNDLDQFYYNILGNYWDTTISNFSFTLTLENAVSTDKVMNLFYGMYGSTNTFSPISPDTTGKVFQASFAHVFQAGEGLTGRIVFDQGYFNVVTYITKDVIILVIMLVASIVGIILFTLYHNKDILTPVVNFEVPNDMPPSDVGYIIDGQVDNSDISSLIVYWAQKGYLQIINKSEDDKKDDLYLLKVKDADDKMCNYEKQIFNAIFTSQEEISIKKIGEKIYTQVAFAKNEIRDKHEGKNFSFTGNLTRGLLLFASATILAVTSLIISVRVVEIWHLLICLVLSFVFYISGLLLMKIKDKEYVKKHTTGKIICYLIAVAVLVTFGILTFSVYGDVLYLTFISIILSGTLFYLSSILNIRTKYGIEILGQILGFKQFIEFTQKDRIEMLVKENPEIFYDILPYAYVLGVSDKWIKNFDGIVIHSPNWYVSSSNNTLLDYLIFRSVFNNLMLNANIAMIAPKVNGVKSSGIGGGFGGFGGGGGFSGGGFGGGGGRGW